MNVKLMGADSSVTNNDGTHWKDTKQVTTARSRLYKLSISAIADVYVWIFDLAAGAAGSVAPVAFRYVPAGYSDTWDFPGDGSLFQNGIYLALSSAAPADPTSTPTASGNDKAILKADVRVG